MKDEYDFSKGVRGQFFRPGARLNIPVYLDQDAETRFRLRAVRGRGKTERGLALLRKAMG